LDTCLSPDEVLGPPFVMQHIDGKNLHNNVFHVTEKFAISCSFFPFLKHIYNDLFRNSFSKTSLIKKIKICTVLSANFRNIVLKITQYLLYL